MDDFGAFCYLDVQKTGSTFISKMLRAYSIHPLLASGKHRTIEAPDKNDQFLQANTNLTVSAPTGGIYRPNCFYFNSVRNPFDYYASLYNYGCDGRGRLAVMLRKSGLGNMYDGSEPSFFAWVEYVLDPCNAANCNEMYGKTCASAVGFLTFRFLRLSVSSPGLKLDGLRTMDEACALYRDFNICSTTLRQESLSADLQRLFATELRQHVLENACDEVLEKERANISRSGVASGETLANSALAQRVIDRDRLIFDEFYPNLIN